MILLSCGLITCSPCSILPGTGGSTSFYFPWLKSLLVFSSLLLGGFPPPPHGLPFCAIPFAYHQHWSLSMSHCHCHVVCSPCQLHPLLLPDLPPIHISIFWCVHWFFCQLYLACFGHQSFNLFFFVLSLSMVLFSCPCSNINSSYLTNLPFAFSLLSHIQKQVCSLCNCLMSHCLKFSPPG